MTTQAPENFAEIRPICTTENTCFVLKELCYLDIQENIVKIKFIWKIIGKETFVTLLSRRNLDLENTWNFWNFDIVNHHLLNLYYMTFLGTITPQQRLEQHRSNIEAALKLPALKLLFLVPCEWQQEKERLVPPTSTFYVTSNLGNRLRSYTRRINWWKGPEQIVKEEEDTSEQIVKEEEDTSVR